MKIWEEENGYGWDENSMGLAHLKAKEQGRDFPGGPVVKNLPANAGDTGSIADPGRRHMPAGQLSPCTMTTEPVL